MKHDANGKIIANNKSMVLFLTQMGKAPSLVKGCFKNVFPLPNLHFRAESRATSESKIRNILCLKTALDLVPCLSEILRTAKSTLLINLRKVSGFGSVVPNILSLKAPI